MSNYFVGDLCYVLPRELYDEIVCSFQYGDGKWHTVNGVTFAFGNTKWGDGFYYDQWRCAYPVDSGTLGIVALDGGFEPKCTLLQLRQYGSVVDFKQQPVFDVDNGIFNIGYITINTDFDEGDDE